MSGFNYDPKIQLGAKVEIDGKKVLRYGRKCDTGTGKPLPDGTLFDRLDPLRVVKPLVVKSQPTRWQDDFYGGPAPMSGAVAGGVDYARPSG